MSIAALLEAAEYLDRRERGMHLKSFQLFFLFSLKLLNFSYGCVT